MAYAYPSPPLLDGDLELGPWDAAQDLGALAAATRDPTIPATTSVPPRYSDAAARSWVARQDRRRQDGQGVVLAIRPDGGPAVGMVGVTGVDGFHGRGNLGYWVVPDHRGRGHASRAAGLVADWAFDALDLVRLESRVATDNAASRRLLERLDFTCEGIARASFRLGDRWVDMAMYARLRTQPSVPETTWDAYRRTARPDDA